MSHASQNVLAQILAYMANADNEQRSTECGSCELSRLGSSKAAERLGLQSCASSDEKKKREETKMTLYDELVARGLIAQVTDEALITMERLHFTLDLIQQQTAFM